MSLRLACIPSLFAVASATALFFAAPSPAAPSAPSTLDIAAQLTSVRQAVLSAEIASRIDRLPLREGAAFKTGDLLVQFDDALQTAQVSRARAAREAAFRTHQANARLLELKSIGQVEFELSRAELIKNEAEVAYAETMLAKTRVLAPFDGRVAERKVRENEFAQPGQPLLEIIDDATPEIEFIAPSHSLAWISIGHAATVRIDETGRNYAARILRISPRVEPVSRTVKVVAALVESSHPDLAPGMSGTISLSPNASLN